MLVNIILKVGLVIAVTISSSVQASQPKANISAELSSHIVAAVKLKPSNHFDDFLKQALEISSVSKQPGLIQAIKNYRASNKLSDSELHMLQRMLGLYSRVKYGHDAMNTLAQLVAVPTFKVDGIEQSKNPKFIELGKIIAGIADEFNLAFRNVDNHVFEITLKGKTDEVIGLTATSDRTWTKLVRSLLSPTPNSPPEFRPSPQRTFVLSIVNTEFFSPTFKNFKFASDTIFAGVRPK